MGPVLHDFPRLHHLPRQQHHLRQPKAPAQHIPCVPLRRWWQQYGYNKLFDCYPCQHIHSMRNDDPTGHPTGLGVNWNYEWTYEVFRVNSSLKLIGSNWTIPNPAEPGVPISFQYSYLSTGHNETWTVLSAKEERYVLIYVCSLMYGWTNVGSIVWVRH